MQFRQHTSGSGRERYKSVLFVIPEESLGLESVRVRPVYGYGTTTFVSASAIDAYLKGHQTTHDDDLEGIEQVLPSAFT
jgi:hypothetical protein